jgi:sugar-phosphatase
LRAAGLPAPVQFVTSTDVVNGKPHPEPFLKGAKILGVAAGDCVVVEDAPAGIRAGKAAGARVIAFPTTSQQKLLVDAGADWVVKNCSKISVSGTERGLQLQLAQEPV